MRQNDFPYKVHSYKLCLSLFNDMMREITPYSIGFLWKVTIVRVLLSGDEFLAFVE